MKSFLHSLCETLVAFSAKFARCFPRGLTLCLALMTCFGFLGSAVAHASVHPEAVNLTLSSQALFSTAHSPLSEESSQPLDLALSFFWEAWDLDAEAKGLLGLAAFQPDAVDLIHQGNAWARAYQNSGSESSFSARNHAPIFLFLQIFRL